MNISQKGKYYFKKIKGKIDRKNQKKEFILLKQ